MKGLVAAVALCGCDPTWGVTVRVEALSGMPVEDAVVAITGCEGAETSATKTDANGEAGLAGPGHGPRPCLVTVAKPGYRTQQTPSTVVCGEALAECGPHVQLTFLLEEVPSQ